MTTRWQRAPAVLHRRLPDGVMLLSLHGGEAIVLRGSALDLWLALDQPQPADALTAGLAAQHGAEPAAIRPDIDAALADLHDRHLLERTGAP